MCNRRGVDVRVPRKLKGAVIVRDGDTTTTEAAQAAYRMRLVAKGDGSSFFHRIVFVAIGWDDAAPAKEITNDLVAAESEQAERRKDVFDKQRAAFESRVGQINANQKPSFEREVEQSAVAGSIA